MNNIVWLTEHEYINVLNKQRSMEKRGLLKIIAYPFVYGNEWPLSGVAFPSSLIEVDNGEEEKD